MLLTDKVALVYGAGGAIGGAIARAFAERAGRIDISCNVIGVGDVQKPLTELTVEEFLQPVTTALRTQFLTTSAAVRHMVRHGSGVILAFGGSGDPPSGERATKRTPSPGSCIRTYGDNLYTAFVSS